LKAVLRIRDPVFFTPGSGIWEKFFAGSQFFELKILKFFFQLTQSFSAAVQQKINDFQFVKFMAHKS
jgi:hypothetical protein